MLEFFTYKRTLALVVLICAFWVVVILYRVGKGEVIKKVDFWRSKWKIVLFWFIIAALALVVLYVLVSLGLLEVDVG
ncbi:hypothetical protein HN858_03925 [Candidatus Falkowbacteria bacterium]|jgi:hypothetical protein|nr:hypothetical protein [Candidatus Falkowbacteria bacterium]MBT5503379.1 hypothetical protein [Candidatus Falkowbacteria bacterium]MBT6573709.1 hypothetical protein [Candidatus Falkowbacteria bacterium]MBT7348795.1 hypothetical protein [Candidatus Falkowbacteria bacterium]MBT7500600.1 hypothetical protein [Candidatus Falkowbacteria bacterium]